MRNQSGQTLSNWTAKYPPLFTSPLTNDRTCDVCVIGGGIAGLTVAYLLLSEGRSVILLEKDGIGSGESGRTTAHFTAALDDRYFEIEKTHGEENARLAAQSQVDAIQLAKKIIADENIACDLADVPGYLFLGPEHDREYLSKEYEATKKAGLDIAWIDSFLPALSSDPWILFRNQMHLHPMKYFAGLKDAIIKKGGEIFTNSAVAGVEEDDDLMRVQLVQGQTVTAKKVVVATNTPMIDRLKMHTKQAAYRTYVIAARIPRDTFPEGLFWDTSHPYHYIRLERDSNQQTERLIVGCEDHKTGQEMHPEIAWSRLEAWTRERFPAISEIDYQWSGQVMEPEDFLTYAGLNPGSKNVYIITGDSGNGMTNGTIGAKIITDLISERANAYAALYDPSRKATGAIKEFLRENLNMAAQYTDWLKPADIESLAELAPGEGAVLKPGVKPVAFSRDLQGKLHACTAVCPHLKAVLRWNSAEQSWDCPAHGSRFNCDGKQLNGPAISDLDKASIQPESDSPSVHFHK